MLVSSNLHATLRSSVIKSFSAQKFAQLIANDLIDNTVGNSLFQVKEKEARIDTLLMEVDSIFKEEMD